MERRLLAPTRFTAYCLLITPHSAAAADSVQEYSAVKVRVASEQELAEWEPVLGLVQLEPARAAAPVESALPVECWVFAVPSSSSCSCSNGGQVRNGG